MEYEYNGGLCELTFDILMRAGAFGAEDDIPDSLRGAEVQFKFQSPLQEAVDREKGARFAEASQMLATAAQMDPAATVQVDTNIALRDALEGIGVPAKWMRTEEAAEQLAKQMQQAKQAEKMAQDIAETAQVGEQAGKAGVAIAEATERLS